MMIVQEKNKSYEETNSEFVEFVSIPQKSHPFKNPHRLPTEPMGIHHSPHTHTIPIPMGFPWESPYPRQPCKLPREKLETLGYHMVKTRSLYLTWAWYTTGS